MTAFVAPGKHWEEAVCRYIFTDGRFSNPPDVQVYSGAHYSSGEKQTSTSPRITIEGTKWSMSHEYVRGAFKSTSVGGTLSRENVLGPEWGNAVQTSTLEGAIETSLFDSVVVADVNPFAVRGNPRGLSTNHANRLITEMILKAGDRRVSYGEALAESKKTINHLARTATTLFRAYKAARSGNWGALPRLLGTSKRRLKDGSSASSRWLEYSYAWMPLVNDIYGTAEAFQKGLKRPQIIRAARRIAEGEFDLSANSSDSGFWAIKVSGKATSSGQCIGHYRINQSWINNIQQLGLINPAEVAWAIVPFSFMIDWFLPVQNLLEASTATMGMTFIDGCLTQKTTSQCEVLITKVPFFGGANNWVMKAPGIRYNLESSGMKRSPLTYAVPLPYYKSPFSTSHVVSALALLRQLKR